MDVLAQETLRLHDSCDTSGRVEMQKSQQTLNPEYKSRDGVTILELLVTISIIGVLAGLILPAIQSGREAARDLTCRHHLKQIGIGLHSFHDLYGKFPAGWQRESTGETAFGWASQSLAQLDQPGLQNQIVFNDHVSSAANADVRDQTVPVLLCPSDNALRTFSLYPETDDDKQGPQTLANTVTAPVQLPASNYVGVFGTFDPDVYLNEPADGAFMQDTAVSFRDFRRGLSQTFVVGERTARKLPATWLGIVMDGEDAPARVTGFASRGPNHPDSDECEFDSRHTGHANFLFADGHVEAVSDNIDRHVYQQMARRNGSELLKRRSLK